MRGRIVLALVNFGLILLFSTGAAAKVEVLRVYYANGSLKAEFPKKDGKLEGATRWYYESGALGALMSYKRNRLHGLSRTYYENGHIKKIMRHLNNKPIGSARLYDETGRMIAVEKYSRGRVAARWEYGPDGQITACEEPGAVETAVPAGAAAR